MAIRNEIRGPSSLERLVGGDSLQGVYVPPLMAEVLKESAAKKPAPSVQDVFVAPAKPKALSPETSARLDRVREAEDLGAAFEQVFRMPEVAARAAGALDLRFDLVKDAVANREDKCRSAGAMQILSGGSGVAPHFGRDLTLTARPDLMHEGRAILTLETKDLYAKVDWQRDAFATLEVVEERRVRTGLLRFLPGQAGPADVAAAFPTLTPASLADAIRAALER